MSPTNDSPDDWPNGRPDGPAAPSCADAQVPLHGGNYVTWDCRMGTWCVSGVSGFINDALELEYGAAGPG